MNMKKYIFLAVSALALASCQSDDFLGDTPGSTPSSANSAIKFDGNAGKISRASDITGANAAAALDNNFIVYGTKKLSDTETQIVFKNYQVKYDVTNNKWEYTTPENQSLKYWDYSASQYDFITYSLGKGTSKATATDITENGYTLTGTEEQLANCYIADKVTVKKADYNKKVTLTFHSLASKVTIGIYETISGYSVKDVKFYTSETDANPSTTPTLYTTENTIPTSSTSNKMTVSYANGATTPTVTLASEAEKTTKITFGTLGTGNLATDRTSATKPTDPTRILPANAGELTLKVDYTLVSDDGSNETIKITGATVKVPTKYTNWQANFIYTYIFKITENTNGSTGGSGGTAGLHPIVFDAVVKKNQSNSQTTETEITDGENTTKDIKNEGN